MKWENVGSVAFSLRPPLTRSCHRPLFCIAIRSQVQEHERILKEELVEQVAASVVDIGKLKAAGKTERRLREELADLVQVRAGGWK